MGWLIQCSKKSCSKKGRAGDIVDLVLNRTDENRWFRCECGSPGYIEKSFNLQEPGKTWKPYLRGAIPLGKRRQTYQPFVFLVSYKPTARVTDVWFSYYKDLRSSGGRLKLGYGPGGPPVLHHAQLLQLLRKLVDLGCITRHELTTLS